MKQKTKKSISKRIKITAKKKLIRGHAYSSHNKTKKSKARLRRQKTPALISESFVKKFKKVLGV